MNKLYRKLDILADMTVQFACLVKKFFNNNYIHSSLSQDKKFTCPLLLFYKALMLLRIEEHV